MFTKAIIPLAWAASGSASIIRFREPSPGFLSYPITHAKRDAVIYRRDETISVYNMSSTTYLFELKIGTPAQDVKVVLDSGSFELWVDPTCSAASTSDQAQSCEKAGQYDPGTSSTAQDVGATSTLPYGKGEVDIAYVADSVQVPGTGTQKTLSQVIFGVGQGSTDLAYGICGVGHGKDYNLQYNNLIDELYEQGVTQSKALSVALGSKDVANGGSVIFGGIDTQKFSGPLYQFDNLPPQTEQGATGLVRYWIQLDGVGMKGKTYADSSLPVVLDTGATMSYLPQAIIDNLAKDFGATVAQDGSLEVDCKKGSESGTVDFTFGKLTIKVPFHEIVWEVLPGQCFIAAAPVSATTPILGDSFLRSAYVVFDQTNSNIFLAQYKNCGSKEGPLGPAPGAAGNFTGECTTTASGAVAGTVVDGKMVAWVVAGLLMQVVFFVL